MNAFLLYFFKFCQLAFFPAKIKGPCKYEKELSRNCVRFTVEEVLAHLGGDFDIPDVQWLEDEDFEEGELILPAGSVVLPEEEEEEINLRTVQIEETDDSEEELAKGRPSNVTVEEFGWNDNRTKIDIPGFSHAVGPTTILPVGIMALDFFLLFMSNRILQNIVRETNRYASHTLQRIKILPLGRNCLWMN